MNVEELRKRIRHGVVPAMATPLTPDGMRVKVPVVGELVDFLLARGVKGLFVGGTTGEGLLLPLAERIKLHEAAVEAVAGRVPLLVHAGTNNTADTITLARHAADLGVDAIVIITPTFFPMVDADLATYFQQVAATTPNTPVLVYDIPQFAVNGITPGLVRQLREIPNFAGIKCSRLDAQVIRRLIDAAEGEVMLLAGNEPIALGSLALGAEGVISGLSTAVPEPFVALTAAVGGGDLASAQAAQYQINSMLECFEPGKRLGGIKAILAARGVPVGPVMPPRPMPGDNTLWPRLARILELDL